MAHPNPNLSLSFAVTLLSLCILLSPLHAAPYLIPSIGRLPHLYYDPYGSMRALINHVSGRTFAAHPTGFQLIRFLSTRKTSGDDNMQTALSNIVHRQGLIGDQCSADVDCQDPRQCIAPEDGGFVSCSDAFDVCICFAPDLTCSSEDDCDPGEVCAEIPNATENLCVSADFLASVNLSVPATGSITAPVENEASPLIGGLNGDSCESDGDCAGSRACLNLLDGEVMACFGQDNCVCVNEDPTCSSDGDCDSGEVCQALDGEPFTGLCFSMSLELDGGNGQVSNEEDTMTSLEEEDPIPSEEMDVMITETDTDGTGARDEKLNFEDCEASDECAGMRICGIVGSSGILVCAGHTECRCLPVVSPLCMSDFECDLGESCMELGTDGICVSDKLSFAGESDSEMLTEEAGFTEEPEFTTDELEFTTDEPEFTTDEPEITTDEPELTTDEPELTTDEPEFTSYAPELTTAGTEVTTTDSAFN